MVLFPNMNDSFSKHVYGGQMVAVFKPIGKKHGVDGLSMVFDRMKSKGYYGPDTPDEFKLRDKYPFSYYLYLLEGYHEIYDESNFERVLKESARTVGIIGFFAKWLTKPDLAVAKAGEYWPQFFDFGRLEGVITGDNKALVKGYDVSDSPLFCRSITYYFEGVFQTWNVNFITVEHTLCACEGHDHCEWKLEWG